MQIGFGVTRDENASSVPLWYFLINWAVEITDPLQFQVEEMNASTLIILILIWCRTTAATVVTIFVQVAAINMYRGLSLEPQVFFSLYSHNEKHIDILYSIIVLGFFFSPGSKNGNCDGLQQMLWIF